MGMLWEMYQQGNQRRSTMEARQTAMSLEQRIDLLEEELRDQNNLIKNLIYRLETVLGKDLDGDGKVV